MNFTLFFIAVVLVWVVLTLLAALKLVGDSDALARALRRKNRRRHTLGKWLRFHGGLK